MSSSLEHLGEEIAADVTHHDAALHRILTKLRLFDAGGGYVSQGFRTCHQWLAWRVNWTLNTARAHVRVANALGGLPIIDRALEMGQLSYSKVRALTRVANPANEETLVELALHMTGEQLEQACRKLAAVKRHEDPSRASDGTTAEDDLHRRYVRRRDREDGMVVIEAVLHPDEAELVYAALERVARERCRARDEAAPAPADDAASPMTGGSAEPVSSRDPAEPSPARVAAAMSMSGSAEPMSSRDLAEPSPTGVADAMSVSGSAQPPDGSVVPASPRATTDWRNRTRSFDRATALVEIAQQVLRGTSPDRAPVDIMITVPVEILASRPDKQSCGSPARAPKECCSPAGAPKECGSPARAPKECCSPARALHESTDALPHAMFSASGTFVSDAAARRLACDAGVIALVVDAEGNTLSVGRKRRTLPASLKRAMQCRDRKCRYPGCNATAFLEGHHLEAWALGGSTALGNVLSLCSYHHRFVHEYGVELQFDPRTNTVSVHDPRLGRQIPGVTRPDRLPDLGWPTIVRESDGSITADTQPTWDATPIDYGAIVDMILRAEDRATTTAADGSKVWTPTNGSAEPPHP